MKYWLLIAVESKVTVFTAFFLLSIIDKVPILRPNLPVIPVVQMPANSGAYLEIEDHGCKSAIFTYILLSMVANSKEDIFLTMGIIVPNSYTVDL